MIDLEKLERFINSKNLGELLLKHRKIKTKALTNYLIESQRENISLGDYLVKNKIITLSSINSNY